jgi:hypothetical protein
MIFDSKDIKVLKRLLNKSLNSMQTIGALLARAWVSLTRIHFGWSIDVERPGQGNSSYVSKHPTNIWSFGYAVKGEDKTIWLVQDGRKNHIL